MLTLVAYLIRHSYLPPVAGVAYVSVGVLLAVLAIRVLSWRWIVQQRAPAKAIGFVTVVVAEWPLVVLGFLVFRCITGRGKITG